MINMSLLGKCREGQKQVLQGFSRELRRFGTEFLICKEIYSYSYYSPKKVPFERPMQVIFQEKESKREYTIFAPTLVNSSQMFAGISRVVFILLDYGEDLYTQLDYLKSIKVVRRPLFVGVLNCEDHLRDNHDLLLTGIERFFKDLGFRIHEFAMGKDDILSLLIRII